MDKNIQIYRFTRRGFKIILLALSFTFFTYIYVQSKLTQVVEFHKSSRDHTEKVKQIAFLKIPKTGSSTAACIFLRFGIKNNLSMLLTEEAKIFDSDQELLLEQKKQYDIFIIHTNYSYKFFTNIIRNPAIIGTVRRPEKRLISHAFFFKLKSSYRHLQVLSDQRFINELVKDTEKYGVSNVISSFFGIKDFNISDNSLHQYLRRLNSEFTLVIVLEKLDESLILLKRLLRWSVFDIIYAAKKTRHYGNILLNASQIKYLKSTNKLEYAIYDFFDKELDKKIRNAGDNFTHEVLHFKDILNKTNEFCHTPNNTVPFYTFPASNWDDSFSITTTDCHLIYRQDVAQFKKKYPLTFSMSSLRKVKRGKVKQFA